MKQRTITLALGKDRIDIRLSDKGGGTIESTLKQQSDEIEDWSHYNAMIDAFESVVLAHAVAGVDVANKAYIRGLKTALEAIENRS